MPTRKESFRLWKAIAVKWESEPAWCCVPVRFTFDWVRGVWVGGLVSVFADFLAQKANFLGFWFFGFFGVLRRDPWLVFAETRF